MFLKGSEEDTEQVDAGSPTFMVFDSTRAALLVLFYGLEFHVNSH